MMKNIDILFFIEHKDREMDGTKRIIEYLLENEKLDIVVANTEFGFFDAFWRYNPKVVCLPYCRSKKNHVANAFYTRNPEVHIINLNYEQIFNPTTIKFKRPQDWFAKEKVYHIAWGEQFKRYLIDNGVCANNIFITGKPEIFFLKEMVESSTGLRKKMAEEFTLDITKKWCFLPLNDGTAFMSEDRIKEEISQGKRLPASLESHRIAKKQVELLLKYIQEVKEKRKEIEFILRPHPGVSINEYADLLAKLGIEECSNLHIIREYSVKEWLCCSNICISNWSTVILDASAIGLPTYVFQPEKLPEFLDAPWIDIFKKITDYSSFEQLICENSSMDVSSNYISEYIDLKKKPIEEISRVILSVMSESVVKVRLRMFNAFIAEYKHLLRSKLRSFFKDTFFEKRFVNEKLKYDFFDEQIYFNSESK